MGKIETSTINDTEVLNKLLYATKEDLDKETAYNNYFNDLLGIFYDETNKYIKMDYHTIIPNFTEDYGHEICQALYNHKTAREVSKISDSIEIRIMYTMYNCITAGIMMAFYRDSQPKDVRKFVKRLKKDCSYVVAEEGLSIILGKETTDKEYNIQFVESLFNAWMKEKQPEPENDEDFFNYIQCGLIASLQLGISLHMDYYEKRKAQKENN